MLGGLTRRYAVCNQCFLSVHDAEIVHEDDHCVPAGFICYLPRGPPYVTGPGGLGDLRLQIAPTPSGIIMPVLALCM